MKRILIIDDDIYIGNMLQEVLMREGYGVLRAYSGTEAKLLLSDEIPDLILLDLMLPGLSGEELLPSVGAIPTIVVSAKVDVDLKVDLLLGGAVDYVTKPFDTKELLARISVALRMKNADVSVLKEGGISLNTESRRVMTDNESVKLTRTEYAILKYLMQNADRVVSRSQLLDRIGADTPDCTESSLKIHVSNLRKKLRAISGRECIESVWGIGFKFNT